MVKIGKRIKELRELAGISQEKLAEMFGVSRPTISQMKNDDRRITVEELVKLTEVFNVSIEGLLNLEKEPEIILKKGKKSPKVKPQIRINVPQKNLEKF